MKNPYPEARGHTLQRDCWQEGHDAKEKEDQGLYEALKRIATKLESWGKGNLSESEEYTLQEANQALAKVEK